MRLISIAACLLSASAAAGSPVLRVPPDLTAPMPAPTRLSGVAPGAMVTIETIRRDPETGRSDVGTATFKANRHGRVDTARQAPRRGSYSGVDPLGIFWSARARPARPSDPRLDEIAVTVRSGGRLLVTAVSRRGSAPSTMVIGDATPFPGAVWARPAGPGRHPVLIVLGGSEGGSSTARDIAPLFAARGYATLGLPYYNPGYDPTDRTPGLPTSFTEIPVDRLVAVRAWLAQQPDANVDRLGIWGVSKGAEFALIAASRYAWIKAVVAVVPTDVVWEGWGGPGPTTASFAVDGHPLPFEPYAGMAPELAKAARGEPMDLRRVHLDGRAANPDRVAAARIPIERFRGALLVAGGGRDAIWPSLEMATAIERTRTAAGEATTLLVYPDAGHALGGPGTAPTTVLTGLGGTPVAIAKARADVWRQTLIVLDGALLPARAQ